MITLPQLRIIFISDRMYSLLDQTTTTLSPGSRLGQSKPTGSNALLGLLFSLSA
jgi:hypothetical protein